MEHLRQAFREEADELLADLEIALLELERNPGDLELVDAESGATEEVSMGQAVLRRYLSRLSALQAELKTFALRAGGDFFVSNTARPLREFIFGPLRAGRLLR